MQFIKAVLAVCVMAMALPAGAKDADWAPETFKLDNGMEVIVLPDHRAPVVTHMVWYRVGAVDELPGKSGIAHLFEHLMFKGTDTIPAGEFSKIVARNGGQDNAFTSWDYTGYFQRVAKDRLDTMMRMEADRMMNLRITEEEFVPELEVVKEERRQVIENNPSRVLFEKTAAELFKGHPYSIPIIGFMDEVEQLTMQDAEEFYAKWYGPENAILVIAGDITAAELRPLAEEIYGVVPRKGDALAERLWPEIPPLEASLTISHSDPKVRQESWSEYWQGPVYTSGENKTLDAHAMDIASEILGGGRTSRLYQALVEEQKIAVSAYSWTWTTFRSGGAFVVGASPRPDSDLEAIKAAALEVLNDFIATGPTPEELVRAKSNMKATAVFARDSQSSMARLYGSARVIDASIEDVASWPDEIDSVTAEDIQRVMTAYLSDKPSITSKLLKPEE